MIHPIILHQKGSILHITGPTLQQLIDNPRPVLWCNEGLYGMIPKEVVQNDIGALIKRNKIFERSYYPPKTELLFAWSSVIEIPQETGRALEKYNEGSDVRESIDSGGLPTGH